MTDSDFVSGAAKILPAGNVFVALLVAKKGLCNGNIAEASFTQSGRLDLNQRPPAPEAGALPGYATPRVTKHR